MKRPRLIVHLGTQKTGSTTLQKSMFNARESLLAEGICFPDVARMDHPFKHASVTRAAASDIRSEQDAEEGALRKEFAASSAHTLLLSEERLWRAEAKHRGFFARFKPDFDLTAVVYLRRPDTYLESLYNQATRSGQEDDNRTVAEFAADPLISGRLEYARLLAAWKEVFDEVVPVSFDAAVRGQGLIPSFFGALGLAVKNLPPEIRAKTSPDANLILTIRSMRRSGLAHSMDKLAAADREVADLRLLAPRKHVLGSSMRRRLLSDLQQDMAELSDQWGLLFDASLPENEPEETATEPDPAYLAALAAVLSQGGAARRGTAASSQDRKEQTREKRTKRRRRRQGKKQRGKSGPARRPQS